VARIADITSYFIVTR